MKYSNLFKMLTVVSCGSVLFISSIASAEGDAVDADKFLQGQPAKTEPATKVFEPKSEPVSELNDYEKSLAAAKKELEDKDILKKKIALAKAMHQIRPTRDQVDAAVRKASYALQGAKRKAFVDSMSMMLNYNAIERISIDAMVETYTLLELSSMVEYYSKPEALSASKKIANWASIVQPEIISMIDKALMRIRTGQ